MSSTTLKIFAAIAVVIAIALAVLGWRMSRDYARQSEAAEQQVREQQAQQTLAVVAVKPLAAYKPIAREAVALVPVAVRPADPYGSIEDVVGKQPLVDIDAGAPITRRYFREGNLLARTIPPGYQAVSITVTDVLAVGGFLRPGDVVDILIYLRGAEGVDMPQARVLLEQVRVLAYLEQVIDRPEGVAQEDAARNQRQTRTAVLAIPESDTTKLMLGASLGELRLALHGQQDEPAAEAGAPPATATTAAVAATTPAATAPGRGTRPEKAITSAELARLKPPPGAVRTTKVEIFRGNDRSAVAIQ